MGEKISGLKPTTGGYVLSSPARDGGYAPDQLEEMR